MAGSALPQVPQGTMYPARLSHACTAVLRGGGQPEREFWDIFRRLHMQVSPAQLLVMLRSERRGDLSRFLLREHNQQWWVSIRNDVERGARRARREERTGGPIRPLRSARTAAATAAASAPAPGTPPPPRSSISAGDDPARAQSHQTPQHGVPAQGAQRAASPVDDTSRRQRQRRREASPVQPAKRQRVTFYSPPPRQRSRVADTSATAGSSAASSVSLRAASSVEPLRHAPPPPPPPVAALSPTPTVEEEQEESEEETRASDPEQHAEPSVAAPTSGSSAARPASSQPRAADPAPAAQATHARPLDNEVQAGLEQHHAASVAFQRVLQRLCHFPRRERVQQAQTILRGFEALLE